LIAVLVAGCASGGQPGATAPAGGGPAVGTPVVPAASTGGGGEGLLAAATAAKDHVCTLLPTGVVGPIVPSSDPPSEELFPPRCSVFGATSAIAIWFDLYSPLGEAPAGSEAISGLGSGAYGEKLATTNYTLWVGLGPVGSLAVEVNHDGQGQKDEAISIAKAVLQELGG
jgi:hypothetical protein